ncbi:MAG TPA: hypothetical protein VJA26_14420, partial [Gammaproteobacteria bacterium]|nr:hypothetical protein [Gammaproteobacteria bacterium]
LRALLSAMRSGVVRPSDILADAGDLKVVEQAVQDDEAAIDQAEERFASGLLELCELLEVGQVYGTRYALDELTKLDSQQKAFLEKHYQSVFEGLTDSGRLAVTNFIRSEISSRTEISRVDPEALFTRYPEIFEASVRTRCAEMLRYGVRAWRGSRGVTVDGEGTNTNAVVVE